MIRKNLPVILLSLLVVLLLLGYIMKDNLNDFISGKIKNSASTTATLSGEEWVETSLNYVKNHKGFQYTVLEFRSIVCDICKRMEPELEKISNSQNKKINVIVLNIMNPGNLELIKYFGISAVPIQILLDKKGNEFFRHYGFISAEEIMAKL